MNELCQLQNIFQDYLLECSDVIQDHIVDTEKVSSTIRLSIYKNAYYARLTEALETSYPILKKYIGDEAFERLADDYIRHYPSSFRSIRWFGDQLENFLSESSPHLSELSRFEWMMATVFDAADAKVISLEDVGKIAPERWESMCFKLHPSVHILHFHWNVVSVWQALSDNETPPVIQKNSPAADWIVWRKDVMSHFCYVPQNEAFALKMMISGKSFGEICEGLCQWHSETDAPIQAASLLKGWITAGLISAIYFLPDGSQDTTKASQ